MKLGVLLAAAVVTGGATARGADVPAHYRLVYEQSFQRAESLGDFAMTDAAAWKFGEEASGGSLELAKQSQYTPAFRSPFNMALIKDKVFGDFVLEADVVQTGKEYGHRDMCFFFGFQNAEQFYYAHLATKTDDHAHNIFIVNHQPRTKVSKVTTAGVNWGLNVWHKVRVERTVADGAIRVYFDDFKTPVMSATDANFGAGFLGFGSFDDTGKVDNVRIWSPTAPVLKPTPAFPKGSPAAKP
jgi:hypothetical protein